MLRIVFMGTPDFALASLKAVDKAGYPILAVVTNPDKPKGRGMKLTVSPVKEYASERKFPILQPNKIKNNEEFLDKIRNLNPDVICVVAYGKILPKELLEIPKLGCINVHGSLLPNYRGAAPIQWAVINGETNTGITTMYMNEGMDTGDMILKEEVEIGRNETTGELWTRLAKVGADLLVETLKQIEKGTAPRIKQQGEVSYAPMLTKQMAKIDWQKSIQEIHNLIRGLNPIMGAYCYLEEKKIKIWKTEIISQQEKSEKKPGTILLADDKEGLLVQVKDGVLKIIEIQEENTKRMNACDYIRGRKISAHQILL